MDDQLTPLRFIPLDKPKDPEHQNGTAKQLIFLWLFPWKAPLSGQPARDSLQYTVPKTKEQPIYGARSLSVKVTSWFQANGEKFNDGEGASKHVVFLGHIVDAGALMLFLKLIQDNWTAVLWSAVRVYLWTRCPLCQFSKSTVQQAREREGRLPGVHLATWASFPPKYLFL